ncbi:MAG: DUF2812 domain-containing protein [Propionibacteriaceae bacterium]|nr:DUF2812 domain-containing protein [Propionibacteriaceae bacterium]
MDAFQVAEDVLNKKMSEGWQLTRTMGRRWGFARKVPEEYIYRIVILRQSYHYPKSQAYLRFLATETMLSFRRQLSVRLLWHHNQLDHYGHSSHNGHK